MGEGAGSAKVRWFLIKLKKKMKSTYEPAHNKIYNKTCVTSKDSDQHIHPPSMDAVEGTCDKRRH